MKTKLKTTLSLLAAAAMLTTTLTVSAYDDVSANFNRISDYYNNGMYYEANDEITWLKTGYSLSADDWSKASDWASKVSYAAAHVTDVYDWFGKIQSYCDQGLYYEARDELNWLAGTYTLTPVEQAEWDAKAADANGGISKVVNATSKKSEFQTRLNDIMYRYKHDKSMTTSAMNAAGARYYDEIDTLLNEIYQYVKTQISADAFEELKADEINWISYKEQKAQESYDSVGRGTARNIFRLGTLIDLTEERCNFLLGYIQ